MYLLGVTVVLCAPVDVTTADRSLLPAWVDQDHPRELVFNAPIAIDWKSLTPAKLTRDIASAGDAAIAEALAQSDQGYLYKSFWVDLPAWLAVRGYILVAADGLHEVKLTGMRGNIQYRTAAKESQATFGYLVGERLDAKPATPGFVVYGGGLNAVRAGAPDPETRRQLEGLARTQPRESTQGQHPENFEAKNAYMFHLGAQPFVFVDWGQDRSGGGCSIRYSVGAQSPAGIAATLISGCDV